MAEQSSMHTYLDWTKQRIDEMDAVLASLESKADQMQADTKVKAEPIVAELKRQRDAFRAQAKTQAEAGVGALKEAQAKLETQWNGFEAQVKTYFETVGKQVGQQQVTFREAAAAQAKAWGRSDGSFSWRSRQSGGGKAL